MLAYKNSSTQQVNIEDISHHLAEYLQRLEEGETFVIMKAGKPLATMTPTFLPSKRLRPFGLCSGQFTVPDDFDDPLPDHILAT